MQQKQSPQDSLSLDHLNIELSTSHPIPILSQTPSLSSIDQAIELLPKLPPGPKSTVSEAGVNLFKSFLGSGILGLPYAFANTGVLLGSLSMLLICCIVFYCCHLVFLIFDDFQKPQVCFQDLFTLIMGRTAVRVYNIFLIIVQVGVCASYIIFFTEFFQIVFQTTDQPDTRYLYFLISMCILTPLIMINNLHFFEKYSRIANVFTIVTLLVIMQYAIDILSDDHYQSPQNQPLFKFSGLAGFLGIAIYSFESIGTMFYIKQSMAEPHKFEKLFLIICSCVCLLNLVFSSLCGLAFGPQMHQIVMIGLEKKRPYFLVFQSLYAINLVFSYPLQFFPIMDNINKLKLPRNKIVFLRIFITLLIACFAFIIPQFSTLLNLTGAFAGVTLQFIFPIYTYHMYFRKQVTKSTTILNISIIVFGLLCSIFSIHDSMVELINSY